MCHKTQHTSHFMVEINLHIGALASCQYEWKKWWERGQKNYDRSSVLSMVLIVCLTFYMLSSSSKINEIVTCWHDHGHFVSLMRQILWSFYVLSYISFFECWGHGKPLKKSIPKWYSGIFKICNYMSWATVII